MPNCGSLVHMIAQNIAEKGFWRWISAFDCNFHGANIQSLLLMRGVDGRIAVVSTSYQCWLLLSVASFPPLFA